MLKQHKDAAYWDRGVANVPDMTGAARLLDVPDLRAVLSHFGLALPLQDVLDVGCGTGRARQLCERYLGADIALSAVQYCAGRGIPAVWMAHADDLPLWRFSDVLCISVFTHMDRPERRQYLQAFARRAPRLVADIITGDGGGNVAVWTARPEQYEQDLADVGYVVRGTADYRWDDHVHRYYLAEQP